MEEETGQIVIEIKLVKTDPKIIQKVFARLKEETKKRKHPYIDENQVKTLMRYNIWTIDQFCDVSGLKVSSVNNLARPTFSFNEKKFNSKLNYCFPLPDSDGNGPKFIVRNIKSESYIKL